MIVDTLLGQLDRGRVQLDETRVGSTNSTLTGVPPNPRKFRTRSIRGPISTHRRTPPGRMPLRFKSPLISFVLT